MSHIDLEDLEIAYRHRLYYKVCRDCGAKNPLKAIKCRRCRGKNLRAKKKGTIKK